VNRDPPVEFFQIEENPPPDALARKLATMDHCTNCWHCTPQVLSSLFDRNHFTIRGSFTALVEEVNDILNYQLSVFLQNWTEGFNEVHVRLRELAYPIW
jgi:hypothetical protein